MSLDLLERRFWATAKQVTDEPQPSELLTPHERCRIPCFIGSKFHLLFCILESILGQCFSVLVLEYHHTAKN